MKCIAGPELKRDIQFWSQMDQYEVIMCTCDGDNKIRPEERRRMIVDYINQAPDKRQLTSCFNPLTPNDAYRRRTAMLTSKIAFYIFIQQIYVLNILNMV